LHAETRGAYGWPRLWRGLVPRVIPVGKDRSQKRMQPHGIKAKGRLQLTTNMGSAS
jgi:putative transposase